MLNVMKRFVKEEEGQTMIEYGLLAVLISVAAILAITGVGTQLAAVFNGLITSLTPAA